MVSLDPAIIFGSEPQMKLFFSGDTSTVTQEEMEQFSSNYAKEFDTSFIALKDDISPLDYHTAFGNNVYD
jgi:hypothetical protein